MLVDSKKKKLPTEDIILQATRETKSQYTPDQVLASILVEAQEDDSIMMREGNTLFLVHKAKGRTAFFRALNADTANNYLNNSVVFAKAMYAAGFDVMVTEFEDPTLLNIFKYVEKNRNKINPDVNGKAVMGFATQKTTNGGYRVTVVLGPKRKGEIK
jgi:hypothetical protein